MKIFFRDSSGKMRVLESEAEINLENQEAVRAVVAKNSNIKPVGAILGDVAMKTKSEDRGSSQGHTFNRLMREYYDSGERKHLRLGQYFINHYVEGEWPELYNEEDEYKAAGKIYHWLIDNKLTKRMPKDISASKS